MNRFAQATAIPELIRQTVGAASRCWENPGGAGIFDSDEALKVSNESIERLNELLQEHFQIALELPNG